MKKAFLFLAGLALTGTAIAQVHFSPEIGINFANMHGESGGVKNDYGIKLGVKAGVNADIWVGNRFVVQPGLFFTIKGAKGTSESTFSTYDDNYTINYFEVPLNFNYYFNDPGEGRFFIGAGGYLAVPFSGKDKIHYTTVGLPDQDETVKLHFGSDAQKNDLERWDFGLEFNAGYYLRSGIFFRGMYQLGLANNIPDGNSDNYIKNSNITASIGFVIGGKR